MATSKIAHEVKYELVVSESELMLIRRALHLVNNFGEVGDWEPAFNLLNDLSVED
ncbi:hypothetical protein OIE82_27320 [Streptomyces althioticus]|uniref:Uncharacterized protein n=1 Tax=Streptomyces althioticus TaxID=83380 RepID=A0ABZ1YEN9_9ACTN